MTQPRRRFIFHWTTPKNFLAIILFIVLIGLLEYTINITLAPNLRKAPNIILPLINTTISPYYHLLPAAVIVSLTSCFIHLTTHTATRPTRIQPPKVTRRPRRKLRFKTIRQSWGKIAKAAKRIKGRIMRNSLIAYIEKRVALAKALIRSAATVAITFIIVVLLINILAYPKLAPTAVTSFFTWNQGFLNFVIATMRASEAIVNAIPPIGTLAASLHNVLINIAPAFRQTLEGATSGLTNNFVSLSPIGKYLLAQNIAVWIVITVTLLYTRFVKISRR